MTGIFEVSMLDSNLNRLFLITLQGLLAEGPQMPHN